MTLVTHAFVGAAAASLFPSHPYAAFAAAFASHLTIDALPHWNEGRQMLRSVYERPDGSRDMRLGKSFALDLAYLAAESLAGTLLAILAFVVWLGLPLPIVLIGAAAGLLPDALHFVYFKTRSALLRDFERFHSAIQREYENPLYLLVEAGVGALAMLLVVLI